MTDPIDVAAGAAGGLFSAIGGPIVRALGGQWRKVQWEFAEAKYRERIIQDLAKTRLLGSANEINLESLFTEVFFVPEASASRRFSSAAMSFSDFSELNSQRNTERLGAKDALTQNDRLYILGTPGAGKSTFLKHVAVSAAKGQIFGLPIFVSLKDWSDSKRSFIDHLTHEFDVCGFADAKPVVLALLNSGDAILLLDGLDEVATADGVRDQVVKTIVEIERKYPQTKILLTCRTSANDHSFSQFKYVEIADFHAEQQEHFVKRWFSNEPAKASSFLEQFSDDTSRTLRELGRKPLLLAFLCITYEQTLDFPRTKSALHAEAIDVLLNKWDASRSIKRDQYGLTGAQRKRQFLAQLAIRTFELDKYAISTVLIEAVLQRFLLKVPGAEQYQEVDAGSLARSLEAAHGIIVERAVGLFAFSHLSIHEYFAALGIVNRISSGEQWNKVVPAEAVRTPRWREVLLHVGSTLHDGDEYFAYLKDACDQYLQLSNEALALFARVSFIASHDDLFARFSKNSAKVLKESSSYADAFHEDFYPSSRLSNSVTRFERSLLYLLRQHRQFGRPIGSGLTALWRRLEVLREILSWKHGIGHCVGMIANASNFDDHLTQFIDSQDVLLIMLDDIFLSDRDRARSQLLS